MIIWEQNGDEGAVEWCCAWPNAAVGPLHIDTGDGCDWVKLSYPGNLMWQAESRVTMGDNTSGNVCGFYGSDYDTDCGWDVTVGGQTNWCDKAVLGYGEQYAEAGAGSDLVVLVPGDTTGTSHSRTLRGGADDDKLIGGDLVDTLFGDEDNDVLIGGGDDDTLSGGIGEDWLLGAEDADLIYGNEDDGYGNDTSDGDLDTMCGNEAIDEVNGYYSDLDRCADSSDVRSGCYQADYCSTFGTSPF